MLEFGIFLPYTVAQFHRSCPSDVAKADQLICECRRAQPRRWLDRTALAPQRVPVDDRIHGRAGIERDEACARLSQASALARPRGLLQQLLCSAASA